MNRKIFLFAISFLVTLIIDAQKVIEDKKEDDEYKVFEKVGVEAYTNQKAWADHINKYTQLPDSILKNIPAGTYTVTIQFIVDVHGSVGQIKALNDPGYGLAKKAENAVSAYKGSWQPANQCGRSVKAYKKQLVTFVIPAQ